jgi:MFS transporter, Spinster family, sphingosine-1-phosphate transporter
MTIRGLVHAMRRLSPTWVLVILTTLNLLNYLDRYVLSSVLESISKEWNLTDSQAGRLGSAFMLGYFVTSPLFGYMGDRASRKWLIAFGVMVWSLGTVLSGFAAGFGILLMYRVLVGVGEASYGTISPGVISDVFPPEKRNNAMTIFYVAIPVGAAMGSLLGGLFENWRDAFIYAGLPGFVLALWMLPYADPPRVGVDATNKPGLKDIMRLFDLREKSLWNYHLVVWGYTAYTFVMGAFALWGPTFFQRVHGMTKSASGTYFGAILVISGLFGTLLGGFAATRWQRKNPAGYALALGWSVLLAAPIAFVAFQTSDRLLSTILFGMAVFLLFVSAGPVNTLILETVPANVRSSAMAGSIFIIHMFGDLWSPAIVGWMSDRFGLQKGVMILPLMLLVAAALWLWLAKRQTAEGRPRMLADA